MIRHRKDTPPTPPTESDPPVNFYASIIAQALENTPKPDEPDEIAIALRNVKLRQKQIDRTIKRALLPERRQRDEQIGQLVKQIEERDSQIQQLSHLVKEQRQEIRKLQAPDADRACMLTHIVHAIKSAARKKSQYLTQVDITLYVDKWLEKRRRELRDVCPPGWLEEIEIKKFPRLFSECMKHPTLNGKAKTLITRA